MLGEPAAAGPVQAVSARASAGRSAEHARLRGLFDSEEALEVMRRRLAHGLQDGSIALDREGLADHLRLTVVNQLAIDQPRYSGLYAALAVS